MDIIDSVFSPYLFHLLPSTPFDRQMSSELSYSIERCQKDEEESRPNVPILALNEISGSEPTEAQERPVVRRAKLAFARDFPRTYRLTSKVLLYLRGPRPKRDLDRASCLAII